MKSLKAIPIAALLGFSLSGCTSTTAEVDATGTPTTQSFSENYQEIFRRTSSTAKRCFAGNINAQASIAVDSEIYSELGYAEISMSLINWGYRDYYATARIEKAGTGSRMITRPGKSLGASNYAEKLTKWATGDQSC